jgi:hypothetical protein
LALPRPKSILRFGLDEAKRLPAPEQLDQSAELRRTRVWRRDQFTALGFDSIQATLMADDSLVDLAQARKLVALGCPLETASRILL